MTRNLYIAETISALDTIAKASEMKKMKLFQAYKAAERLYTHLERVDHLDEEKTYIYLIRYLIILDYIFQNEPDKKFFELRYRNVYNDIKIRSNELRINLINRYQALEPTITIHEVATIPITKPEPVNIFGLDKYISSQQLYEAHSKRKNMLIMDVRPANNFQSSHLKEYTVINIDDALVTQGLSAHRLGVLLPNDVKELYEKRDNFEYIVLLDLDTSQDTYMTSKIRTLYSILTEWDYNTIYKHPPYILRGGYIDFVDRYPTFSTNPILLRDKYQELDELLNLEAIQYPDEVATVKEEVNRAAVEIDNLYKEILDIATELLNIEKQLLDKYTRLYDPNNIGVKNKIETDISQLIITKAEMNSKKQNINTKLQSLLAKRPRENIQKKAELHNVEYQIANISREIRKLTEAQKSLKEIIPTVAVNKAPETIGDRPSLPIPKDIPKPEIPTINRATKPRTVRPKLENLGLVGLANIRNTCYMNSIIQCFRHLPSIKKFFMSGRFEREITRDQPSLIYETADLVRRLWTSKAKSIYPNEFYKKVVALNPTFKRGNHEDANEFFMFVYDLILEDTATAVTRDKYAEAKYQTLYDRIQYKTSFFVKEFYHQIRTDCICGGCGKRCLKYDIENVLMMGVPERGSCSIEEMYDEFMHTCDISDYYCRNCERKSDIIREFSYQPKVISFLLKRYTYGKGVAEKITVPCDFPIENFRMGRAVYKLWAVSLHQGGMTAGHYTAVCLNSEDGIWYEFNDECVTPINIHARHIKERIYMLFYESEDGSEEGFTDK